MDLVDPNPTAYLESGIQRADLIPAEKAPASVTFQPDNTPADYTYDGEYLHVRIPKLDIHTIIVVE